MRETASENPALCTAVVFGGAAFLGSMIVAVFYVGILVNDGMIPSPSGVPFDAFLFLYILLLPGLTTAAVGAAMGRNLLNEGETLSRFQAASVGARIAAIGFLLWLLEGVPIWLLVDFPDPATSVSSVIFILTILGYLLVGIVWVVVILLGAALGVWLSSWNQHVPGTPKAPRASSLT